MSRALHEKTVRDLEGRIVHWEVIFQRVHDEKHEGTLAYVDLLNKYYALKLQGAAPLVPDLSVRQPLSTDLADEEAAMDEAAKPVEVGPFRDED